MKRALARALIVVMAATMLVGALESGSRPALARTTNKTELQVWTANLRKMNHIGPNLWKKFVNKMAAHNPKPDLIALTEVCNQDRGGVPYNDVREFIMYLETKTGMRYDYKHSGNPGTECEEANSMVVWRARRFEYGKSPFVRRWAALTDDPKEKGRRCSNDDGRNQAQVAVALRDKKQKKTLVVSAVHLPVLETATCINENVLRMDRALEKLRQTRPLTIVGGDFNQNPQYESGAPGDEQITGTMSDPACWYRSLNLLTAEDLSNCVSKPRHSIQRYTPGTDFYLDAVHTRNPGPTPGTAHPSICTEWTHSRKFASRGTACTDISGPDDVPDGRADRGRIDYIFARWERPNGTPLPIDSTNAPSLITEAATDDTRPPRYSDHRAVRALVQWCIQVDPC